MKDEEGAKGKGRVLVLVKNSGGEHLPGDAMKRAEPRWVLVSEIFHQQDQLSRNMLFRKGVDKSSNSYIIFGEYLTIIDPGSDFTQFIDLFQQPQYAPGDVRKIVLTDGSMDHSMGALGLFRYRTIRDNPELQIVLHSDCPAEIKKIVRRFGVRLVEVRGGEKLDLAGFQWEVIPDSKYSADGIGLYERSTKTLVSDGGIPQDSGLAVSRILPVHGAPVAGLPPESFRIR